MILGLTIGGCFKASTTDRWQNTRLPGQRFLAYRRMLPENADSSAGLRSSWNWLKGIFGHRAAPPARGDVPGTALPDELERWLRAGQEHRGRGEPARARGFFRQVLEREPQQADALHGLGLVAESEHRNAEAAELFRAAVRARPQEAEFHYALGAAVNRTEGGKDAAAAQRAGG